MPIYNPRQGGGGGTPGGLDTQIQFNDVGNFAGGSGFMFDKSSGNVGIGTTNPLNALHIEGNLTVSGVGTTTITGNGYPATFGSGFSIPLGGEIVLSGEGGNQSISSTDNSLFIVGGTSTAAIIFTDSFDAWQASLDLSLLATNQSFALPNASGTFFVISSVGTTALVNGASVVNNSYTSPDSMIFLTPQDNNTIGAVRISNRTSGGSFTINSTNILDSGVVAWIMKA